MHPTPIPQVVRRARAAVAVLFVLNGLGFSSIVARYPLITRQLGISNTVFGLIIALGPLCGLVTGVATSRLMRRFGTRSVAVWANVGSIGSMFLILNAPHAWVFALGVILMSSFDVYTDIAMNAQGLRVQKSYGRSIINTFHAFWSVGAVIGGGLGSLFAAIALPLWAHSGVMVMLMAAGNIWCRQGLLRPPAAEESGMDEQPRALAPIPARLVLRLVLIGLVAAFAASVEDSGSTWSALYLSNELGAGAGIAGLGFTFLMASQMVGRFTGDALVNRMGDRSAARLGCGLASLVWAAALLFPSVPLTLLAFAVVGWGVATVVPATYFAADNAPGLKPGDGLMIVNWLLRFAFLVGPPVVGRLSDLVSLRVALVVMPGATLVVVALSGVLSAGHQTPSDRVVMAQAEADRTS